LDSNTRIAQPAAIDLKIARNDHGHPSGNSVAHAFAWPLCAGVPETNGSAEE